eukprot:COSAG01_NODE_20484_length_951_cov_0.782864_2_plen_74_part_00
MADERGLIGALASAMMEVLADATLPTDAKLKVRSVANTLASSISSTAPCSLSLAGTPRSTGVGEDNGIDHYKN